MKMEKNPLKNNRAWMTASIGRARRFNPLRFAGKAGARSRTFANSDISYSLRIKQPGFTQNSQNMTADH
jgi:hypothetical protein